MVFTFILEPVQRFEVKVEAADYEEAKRKAENGEWASEPRTKLYTMIAAHWKDESAERSNTQ